MLSFDDGPGAVATPALADLLRDRQAPATFFCPGSRAIENRSVVEGLRSDGHEVGSHGHDHANAWKVGPRRAIRDIKAGIEAMGVVGGDQRLFRPPYGKMTVATLAWCWLKRLRIGWWTIDTKDVQGLSERHEIDTVLRDLDDAGGGVVLMHDRDNGPDEHQSYLLDLTEAILDFAERDSYEVVRLSDL